ncbi:MAG: helix-turn-helix domain-containing protein [Solirubrobacterales bacterium]|nr:helix-turn-helix domain-containing protein [Solirubrobacterales bacterium]
MSPTATVTRVGELLREWRSRRRRSQLDLATEAGVSARHLSFLETGRSQPSREMLLTLAEHLEVPLREQNALLLAAGYAPLFTETPLDNDEMRPVRRALKAILTGHEPYPAIIVDRQWEMVAANQPAQALLRDGVSEELLAPPANALRITLHPKGLAPHILNFGEWSAHLITRLHRQALLSQDPALVALEAELLSYPGVEPSHGVAEPADMLFVPLEFRRSSDGAELSMLSTLATFGTALDITLEELSIESFFPANEATEDYLRGN